MLLTSLKRKRDKNEYDDEGTTKKIHGLRAGENAERCPQATVGVTPDAMAVHVKRARRMVSTVAQTATAVTIGAVVTWSALAFS
jgi:hypothetical protein